MVPELGTERQLIGAIFDQFEDSEHFGINVFRKWSSRSRILWAAGGRGGSRGGGGEAAARFRNQEVQKRPFPNPRSRDTPMFGAEIEREFTGYKHR